MQIRHGTFAALRRLALQDLKPAASNLRKWDKPASRLLHYHATPVLRKDEQPRIPFQIPQPGTNSAPPKNREKTRLDRPEYDLTFTCKPCGTRSAHLVSKQGYHHGSVLVTCPECHNRHVISDHLGIFLDKSITIEDLMQEKGQLVKKGTLSEDGALEFWEDGSITDRAISK